jgi:hypothetical protein
VNISSGSSITIILACNPFDLLVLRACVYASGDSSLFILELLLLLLFQVNVACGKRMRKVVILGLATSFASFQLVQAHEDACCCGKGACDNEKRKGRLVRHDKMDTIDDDSG